VKRSNFLLSVLLVPAVFMQAQTTCTGGGGGSTPPAPGIPAWVIGVQTYSPTTPTLYNFLVDAVSSSNSVFSVGTSYGVWCTLPSGLVPGGGTNPGGSITPPPDPIGAPGGVEGYIPYNYAQYSVSTQGGSFGSPGPVFNTTTLLPGTTVLTLAEEWNAVNWILNNTTGATGELTPTPTDIQGAIWQLLHPDTGGNYTVPFLPGQLTSAAAGLYNDALLHGTGFIPTTGEYVSVLLMPNPVSTRKIYQGFLLPVKIACTSTGSAKITKTSSVTNANAFQLITYKYVVTNTGSTTLTNLVVVDDNGTPAYAEDDVTVGTLASLAPGASYTFTSTVYLPISLFYQSGGSAAFDTLIPQVPATPANSLLLTYLIDSDVSDNTYGTGASKGWGTAGHTFAEELGNYAEFALYDALGREVSDFNADYLSHLGVSATYPSGYGSAGLHGSPIYGGTTYIDYITSTLADNLNGYAKFYSETTNSPLNDVNWQKTAGYKVIVSDGIFGWFGMGSAEIKKNFLNVAEAPFGSSYDKCVKGVSYSPKIVCSNVTSTAWLAATVCGCTTTVHAQTSLCVKLNGYEQPVCMSASYHNCQAPVKYCGCQCPSCKAGQCGKCTDDGCGDAGCQQNKCPHKTINCVISGKTICYKW